MVNAGITAELANLFPVETVRGCVFTSGRIGKTYGDISRGEDIGITVKGSQLIKSLVLRLTAVSK
jgi:hypothetical protein